MEEQKNQVGYREKFLSHYQVNELKYAIGFFLAGFIFDVFTLSSVDDPLSILQQVVYLTVIAGILYYDFLAAQKLFVPKKFLKVWQYREFIMHFLFGSLLSVYSLFFLKSASLFSSIAFILLIIGLLVANELPQVQKSRADFKVALWVLCVFCFFSMLIPVILTFVGWIPFGLTCILTGLVIWLIYRGLAEKVGDKVLVRKTLINPGATVIALFLIFYAVGWIPPVPLATQTMGIYHGLEKTDGKFILSYERPAWKFWQSGDQDFKARPGDQIFFFSEIYSPARFADQVIIHWLFKDSKRGWVTADKVPMSITGGRERGFRGYSVKSNYQPGRWRVQVETTDGREIGRLYLTVSYDDSTEERTFSQDIY